MNQNSKKTISRVQTGVRIEKRILKVLKTIAAEKEIGLGDLLEGIVLHAFEGKQPFSEETLEMISGAKKLFDLDLSAADAHQLIEADQAVPAKGTG